MVKITFCYRGYEKPTNLLKKPLETMKGIKLPIVSIHKKAMIKIINENLKDMLENEEIKHKSFIGELMITLRE